MKNPVYHANGKLDRLVIDYHPAVIGPILVTVTHSPRNPGGSWRATTSSGAELVSGGYWGHTWRELSLVVYQAITRKLS